MNKEDLSFDNFLLLSTEEREELIKDYDALKIMIRKNLSERRYLHSLSTADTCRELARCHGVDEEKAYLCGLLHDCCKYDDKDDPKVLMESYLKKYDPEKLNGLYPAYHSWVAPYYLKEKLGFADEEVLNAIYNHTICTSTDKLSLILFIADKREPRRGIEDGILELAKQDLEKAYEVLNENIKEYLESRNERFVGKDL